MSEEAIAAAPVEGVPPTETAAPAESQLATMSPEEVMEEYFAASLAGDNPEIVKQIGAILNEEPGAAPEVPGQAAPIEQETQVPQTETPPVEEPAPATPKPAEPPTLSGEDALIQQLATTKGISLSAAVALYAKLNDPEPAAATPPAPAAIPNLNDRTIPVIESEIASITYEMEALEEDRQLLSPEYGKLQRKLDALTSQKEREITLAMVRAEGRQAQAQAADAAAKAIWANSETEVKQQFPDMGKKGSDMFVFADALANNILATKSAGDPEFDALHSPNAPMWLATEVAKRMGKAPSAAVPPKAPAAISGQPKPYRPAPAPGSKTSAQASPATTDAQLVQQAEEEFDALFDGGKSREVNRSGGVRLL